MQCGLSPELDSWILHWTPKIKVVEPPELRQRINDLHRRGLDELA
jgi:predicted DNA-binding transcriptional regulator YafY